MRAPIFAAVAAVVAGVLTLTACTSSTDGSGAISPGPTTPATGPSTSAGASSRSAAIDPNNSYTRPELAAAKAIPGVVYRPEPDHLHVSGVVQYDTTPPTGGNHSQYWADCTGTVYPAAIANENAVHMLEHGAVWVTYRPGLAADQVAALIKLVAGVDYSALSPYPGLKSEISLQAWDYQLTVSSASDPRVAQFFTLLRQNPATTPEPGASCSQPLFKQHPTTFGHPTSGP